MGTKTFILSFLAVSVAGALLLIVGLPIEDLPQWIFNAYGGLPLYGLGAVLGAVVVLAIGAILD